jgi:hypothetical protein
VGGDAAGTTRSTLPVGDAVDLPALRKVREERATHSLGGFCSLKAGPPARFLKFHHPITGEQINLEAALPSGFSLHQWVHGGFKSGVVTLHQFFKQST